MSTKDLLSIYLRDHHAASVAVVEVAKRSARSNAGTSFGDLLEQLNAEVHEDLRSLESIMDRIGIQPARSKDGAAWVAEKMGRLKLNGSLTTYSPLSRVVELEGLALGVEANRGLWRSLQQLEDPRFDRKALQQLETRADDQRRRIEEARLEASRVAFTRDASST